MATMLTFDGEDFVAQKITGALPSTLSSGVAAWVHWGQGAGAAARASTDLSAPTTDVKVAGTVSLVGSSSSALWQNVATLTASSAATITNAGCFTSSSSGGGGLVVVSSFVGVALSSGDAIQFTFQLNPNSTG